MTIFDNFLISTPELAILSQSIEESPPVSKRTALSLSSIHIFAHKKAPAYLFKAEAFIDYVIYPPGMRIDVFNIR
jgi:hypothetical protein